MYVHIGQFYLRRKLDVNILFFRKKGLSMKQLWTARALVVLSCLGPRQSRPVAGAGT